MRIVFFLPDIEAGVSRIVKNLLKYRQDSKNIRYAVILFSHNEWNAKVVDDDFNADEIIRFRYKTRENAWSVFKRMSATLLSDRDVIVGNDGLEIKMVAALKLKNPLVYILHGDFNYYYSIAEIYHGVIDCFITYSNKIERELKTILPIPAHSRVHKIYYPSASVEKERKVVRCRDDKKETFNILFVGELTKRKGADLLFEIYRDLLEKGLKDFSFEIIGSGNLTKLINRQFRDNLNVLLPGWQPNEYVLHRMATADIFLFPSRLEGLPNVLVEALSMGSIPVASNLESGVTDIIKNGVNGILVPPGDVIAFSNAIMDLYSNRAMFASIKTEARKRINRFEPYQQAELYEQLVLKTSNRSYNDKLYPSYKKGRLLDLRWLPNALVIILRTVCRFSKL